MLPSPTKILFRLINESRSACVRLACCAYAQDENPNDKGKEAFYRIVKVIADELAQEHEVSGTVAMGSLRSNQWRYGKWHKIPAHERTADNYFKLRQDERDNDTINPDEKADQERKAINKDKFSPSFRKNASQRGRDITARRRCATNTVIDVINNDKDYCIRLRNAAGEDKRAKHDFREVIFDIINELKPHKVYRHTLVSQLWKHGAWKDYSFKAEQKKLGPWRTDEHGTRWNQAAWSKLYMQTYMNPAKLGTRIHQSLAMPKLDPKVHDFANTALKTAARNITKELAQYSENKRMREILDSLSTEQRTIKMGMDFAELEARVAAKTGCTPEMLVNQPKFPAHGVQTGRWNSGCYAEKFPIKYGSSLHNHQLDAYAFAARWMNKFTQPKKEEYRMEIKTQTLVNGITLDSLTNQDLISMISNTEDEIRTLEKLKTKSDHITNSIESHKKSCAQLAGFLDDRSNA